MRKENDSVRLSGEEASGGRKDGVVRWVLIAGTLLAIVALSAIWITGAASNQDPNADNVNVSAKIAAQKSEAAAFEPGTAASVDADKDQRAVQNGEPVVEN